MHAMLLLSAGLLFPAWLDLQCSLQVACNHNEVYLPPARSGGKYENSTLLQIILTAWLDLLLSYILLYEVCHPPI